MSVVSKQSIIDFQNWLNKTLITREDNLENVLRLEKNSRSTLEIFKDLTYISFFQL